MGDYTSKSRLRKQAESISRRIAQIDQEHREINLVVLRMAVSDARAMYGVLRGLALDKDEKGDTRYKAATALLALANIGRATITQQVDPAAAGGPVKDPSEMSADELAAIAAELKREIAQRQAGMRTVGKQTVEVLDALGEHGGLPIRDATGSEADDDEDGASWE